MYKTKMQHRHECLCHMAEWTLLLELVHYGFSQIVRGQKKIQHRHECLCHMASVSFFRTVWGEKQMQYRQECLYYSHSC